MKKYILRFLFIFFIIDGLNAEDFSLVKVMDIKQGKEKGQLYIRNEEEVAPSDDRTGNLLFQGSNGSIYIQSIDLRCYSEIDFNNCKLNYIHDTDFLEWDKSDIISEIKDNLILCVGSWGKVKLLDTDYNLLFKVNPLDYGLRINTKNIYYDFNDDIIFYQLYNGDISCIINDSDHENIKYKNNEETLKMISSGIYSPHISLYKTKYLMVDGNTYYWDGKRVERDNYQILDDKIYVWQNSDFIELNVKQKLKQEKIESILVHDSGDIYILSFSDSKQLHTLYRIENNWNPSWRELWYKEHK